MFSPCATLCELLFLVSIVSGFDKTNFVPILTLLDFRLFHSCKFFTETLFLAAIDFKLSPLANVYSSFATASTFLDFTSAIASFVNSAPIFFLTVIIDFTEVVYFRFVPLFTLFFLILFQLFRSAIVTPKSSAIELKLSPFLTL